MDRDPKGNGDDDDDCGYQQVANHSSLRSSFWYPLFYPVGLT